MAPEQLAVSIEGRGKGVPEMIDGIEFNSIDEISQLNGVNWVDYPGNAGMGIQVTESDKSHSQEDKNMKAEFLESLKSMTAEELKEVAEARPDLKGFLYGQEIKDGGMDEKISNLSEQVSSMKSQYENQSKTLGEKIIVLEKENTRLVNQLDAYQVKTKEQEKEKLMERMIKGSKLKAEHVTETFKNQLMKLNEIKIGDKTVGIEEQMKQLIEDREKICVAETAIIDQPGSSTGKEIQVEEQHRLFAVNIFGVDPTKIKKEEE